MRLRKTFGFVLLGVLLPVGRIGNAEAGGPLLAPATEITQLLNHAELAAQYVRQAQMIYNQIQMIRNMVQESTGLSSLPLISGMVMSDVSQMRGLIAATQGLSYGLAANDSHFRATYQPYANLTQPFYTRYQGWAQSTLSTIYATLLGAGIEQDQIMSEQGFNSQLQGMMSSAVGRDQMLEISNVIATGMLGQMQKLRGLVAADMQSKASYQAYQVTKDQAAQYNAMQAGAYVPRTSDASQFGNVPGQ